MPTPVWTRVVIALAAAIWLGIAFLLDVPVDDRWVKTLGGVASAVVLLVLAFDRWIWRWPGVPSLVRRPMLQGTWRARLRSNWPDPETGKPIPPLDAYLVIRQTYSRISVRALFHASQSYYIAGDIVEMSGGPPVLWFLFRSEARTLDRDGNPPRRGAAALAIARSPTLRLEGDYWTEQGTRGDLVTTGYSPRLYDDFSSASQSEYT